MGHDHGPYESIESDNMAVHVFSGAMAGYAEYIIMYPIDTVKTRMQSISFEGKRSLFGVLKKMVIEEGVLSPIRGLTIVVAASGPAHGVYYAGYEFVKRNMKSLTWTPDVLSHGAAGCVATVLHDAVVNPSEVVKQRMQMEKSPCKTVVQCIRDIYRTEGFRAFYKSFATTLLMNIPFQSLHFIVYEFSQDFLNLKREYNPKSHVISGGMAGGVAAAATNPFDVCRTLINTQESKEAVGLLKAIEIVYRRTGMRGFFSGVSARVLHLAPSTAICWSIYEFFKYFLDEHKPHRDGK
ncbi:unnamed protein product [Phyllotreta striolata]|uniref:Mitoferrin-1 n=1 Tax=Phyllotreta striolata TaxID=444603 RepID=A0A9N9TXQ2_PHYSR|nr:unnamed protein product [Phyllotreta striolata]